MIAYFARMVFFALSMLVVLILAQQSAGTLYFFCSRYYSSDIDADDYEDLAHFGDDPDEAECRTALITIGWVGYVPLLLFQAHCLYVLKHYMEYEAGVEIAKELFPDDEDV